MNLLGLGWAFCNLGQGAMIWKEDNTEQLSWEPELGITEELEAIGELGTTGSYSV